ncbi:squamosa promoter-binding-like protein 7 [Prunus yedoensis var. nudiflora]|uniref:Squamosa promoter-binding-like protein 7 n=1 Tax=Prunus yedoensis var. nudiflora TaxID=2094558 RepID=A0A314UPW5_PRUYE|nr:squamosa promoter-binding-like protein 7 [Prunus yedoensis var. nudiflora]
MCLKLGKRHYFEDHARAHAHALDDRHVAGLPVGVMSKRGRGGAAAAAQQLKKEEEKKLTLSGNCHLELEH